MSIQRKSVLALGVIGLGIALSAPALAVNAVGPYYATPAWDQKLPSDTRFIVLTNWNSEAVLDRETGLVWEKVPTTSTSTWFDASAHCISLNLGGRKGWRLPVIQDLASLMDPNQSDPALPSGHPFTLSGAFPIAYWSATTNAGDVTVARIVSFGTGSIGSASKAGSFRTLAWCVRGGQGVDPQ